MLSNCAVCVCVYNVSMWSEVRLGSNYCARAVIPAWLLGRHVALSDSSGDMAICLESFL